MIISNRLFYISLSLTGNISPCLSQILSNQKILNSYDAENVIPHLQTENHNYGFSTFASIPYVHCFTDSPDKEAYDIAILGAPFDTGVTGRPGARFGPKAIRSSSWRISPQAYNIYTLRNPFNSWAKIIDCGDAPLTWLDNTIALSTLEKSHLSVSSPSPTPRIITLGGDHTTTLAALRSAHKRWGPVTVIHFDAHIDTWDPKVVSGGISDYAAVNHGTFLHIAHSENLISNRSIHAGIRAPIARPKKDIRNDIRCGFEIITAREIDRIGPSGIAQKIKERVGNDRVYLSIDIDVLDPAFAPGTGTAEPGGWTTREFFTLLEGLEGINIVGGDVVEVAPVYDNVGETTVLAASQIVLTLLDLMVQRRVD
ncbi:Arginase/deacetylase [Podospora fimiseda]|uniref:Arginase/deacetylase n=1 Tax=Podospora fimiseda TaxID=252190 RepID=A0AAN7H3X1_9PEZI|nr:Arginase/deacetylase [Podospora fimiseda]